LYGWARPGCIAFAIINHGNVFFAHDSAVARYVDTLTAVDALA
jgi:hypothetical protein